MSLNHFLLFWEKKIKSAKLKIHVDDFEPKVSFCATKMDYNMCYFFDSLFKYLNFHSLFIYLNLQYKFTFLNFDSLFNIYILISTPFYVW